MQARFKYRLSRDEYVVGITALIDELTRQDKARTRRIIEQLAIGVVAIGATTVFYPDALPGLLVATVVLAALSMVLGGRWVRASTGQSYDEGLADLELEIGDGGITEQAGRRERRWPWPAVRRVVETPSVIVLELVGWDMVVLPHRLWPGDEERAEFAAELRRLATNAQFRSVQRAPSPIGTPYLLTVGAIAAGVDVLALVVFNLPVYRGAGPPTGDAAFLGTFAALLLVGLGLAYVAYRVAQRGLERLSDSSPSAAVAITHLLVWAVPLYMLAAYFGWI